MFLKGLFIHFLCGLQIQDVFYMSSPVFTFLFLQVRELQSVCLKTTPGSHTRPHEEHSPCGVQPSPRYPKTTVSHCALWFSLYARSPGAPQPHLNGLLLFLFIIQTQLGCFPEISSSSQCNPVSVPCASSPLPGVFLKGFSRPLRNHVF